MEQAQGTDAGGAAGAPRRAGRATRLLARVLADPRPPQRPLPGPQTRARLAAAGGIVLGLGLLLAALVAFAPDVVAALDVPAGQAFRDAAVAHPLLASWATVWSFLVDGTRNVLVVAVVALALVAGRAWPWAAFLVFTTQAGVLFSNVLKMGIGRARPELVEQAAGQVTLSFPSGHAFGGLTVWGSLALLGVYLLPRPWGRRVAAACLAIGLLQPIARLLLAKHWLTDTLGGQLLGLGWLLLCWAAFAWLLTRPEPGTRPEPPAGSG